MIAGRQKQWNFLKNKFESDNISHAYLFTGSAELGKKFIAKEFVKLINCHAYRQAGSGDNEKPCQECASCRAIEKEIYPDFLIVKLKDDKQEIEISQIREANNFLSYKSYYNSYKAVIIDNAELMNVEAQDCFLKTLEEPKGKTVIILVCSRPEMLLPTIFSRCQTVKFFPVGKQEISETEQKLTQELLKIIDSDLAVKFAYAKNANLDGTNFNKILSALQKHFRHLLFLKISGAEEKGKNYPVIKIKKVIELIELISQQISLTNASSKLAFEILLMEI